MLDQILYALICCLVTSVVVFTTYVKLTSGSYNGDEKLDGKTVIITGSESGIGFETAKNLAKRGARIVMVCKDMEMAEKSKDEIIQASNNDKVTIKSIDLSCFDSVRKCADEILCEETRIDVLINNAAVLDIGYEVSEDDLSLVMKINYFGPFLFTNLLLGKIKRSTPSRIINVASNFHRLATLDPDDIRRPNVYTQKKLYSISKLALVYFTHEMARKLNGTGVTVNSLHPGVCISGIHRHNYWICRMIMDMLSFMFKTIELCAHTTVYLSVSKNVENLTGKYFQDCALAEASKASKDENISKRLWDNTLKIVDLKSNEIHFN